MCGATWRSTSRRSDWESHGHGTDPRYNGVVLHVVSDTDTKSTTLHCGNLAPVVSLEPLLRRPARREAMWDPWSLLRPHGYPPPKNVEGSVSTLDRAGDARFLEMSAALAALLVEQEPDQVLYSSLMEALGYSQNREPFLELAHRVPYGSLEEVATGLPPGSARARVIGEVLLATTGLSLPDRGGGSREADVSRSLAPVPGQAAEPFQEENPGIRPRAGPVLASDSR